MLKRSHGACGKWCLDWCICCAYIFPQEIATDPSFSLRTFCSRNLGEETCPEYLEGFLQQCSWRHCMGGGSQNSPWLKLEINAHDSTYSHLYPMCTGVVLSADTVVNAHVQVSFVQSPMHAQRAQRTPQVKSWRSNQTLYCFYFFPGRTMDWAVLFLISNFSRTVFENNPAMFLFKITEGSILLRVY